MPVHLLVLFCAVIAETIGTAALQASQQFTRAGPSVLVVLSYALSFYCLGYTLKFMPVGVVYALWSGLGIVSIAIIGRLVFGQRLDLPAVLGIGLILLGILVIQLFSESARH